MNTIQALIEAEKKAAIADASGYRVTDQGEVFSVASNWRGYGERRLTPHPNSRGYLRVRLILNSGERKSAFIHKLVANAFLPDCPTIQHQLRHLNGDKNDNRACNLAWGTAKQNAEDRDRHGRTARGSKNGFSKLTEKDVSEIRQRYKAGGVTQNILANEFDVTQRAISMVIRGETWAQ